MSSINTGGTAFSNRGAIYIHHIGTLAIEKIEDSEQHDLICNKTTAQAVRQPVARREKRRISIEEIELAKSYAKRGHSLTFSSSLLGLYPQQLAALLDAAGVDDIPFAKGRQSLASKSALAALHDSLRGRSQPNRSPKGCEALARGRETNRKKHMQSAFGVTGTVKDLMEHFGCELTRNSVYKRLRRGMSIEEALTTESMASKKGVMPPWFAEQVEINKRRRAEQVKDAIARKLTPTMLQYRFTEHDIVVTRREDIIWITVEVRTKAGAVLHLLRFVSSFDSGVLFLFNPIERRRIDFIAFDPDNDALIFDKQAGAA
ncbi:MAG: hypothetical protein KA735_04665 [Burkholderiaceae bacterium]|nr:hypothetical protein [Burkholderiaceae bacterium]